MPATYRINAPNVNSECIDGEVIIVNLENGSYYSCVDLGAYLWSRLVAGDTTEAIVHDLVAVFARDRTEIGTTVAEYVALLEKEQLIVSAVAGEASGLSIEVALPTQFGTPELHAYSDMKDMLLLDPVHDVADVGWPAKPGH
jgi:Coenzyme PQQ synthesis protein D (PqqD)